MNRIAVVVLHYENARDTAECLNSLLEQDFQDFDVVVVDNGSVRGKIDEIKEDYKERENFHFIISKDNLGFAKGNNLGFKYAKKELHSNIIILANNDLLFEERDFLTKLSNMYKGSKFDVAGPRIVSLVDGMNQNPVSRMFACKKDAEIRLIKTRVLYVVSFLNLDTVLKNKFAHPITQFEYKEGTDFQLHGACLIFGEQYIRDHDGLYDGTFMYGEEDILRFQVEKENLKMKYLNDIEVKHKEGSSTNSVYKKAKSKRQFFYKWRIDSLKHLLRLMNQ